VIKRYPTKETRGPDESLVVHWDAGGAGCPDRSRGGGRGGGVWGG